MKKHFYTKHNKGFAMLFTVLVISIILAIALGISNLTFKQTLLSNLAKNSQLAFYQADSGVECGMYYDITQGQLPAGTDVSKAPEKLSCGGVDVVLQKTLSSNDYFVYQEAVTDTNPCFSITFDKTRDGTDKFKVSSRGYSTCISAPQQVERGLNVSY